MRWSMALLAGGMSVLGASIGHGAPLLVQSTLDIVIGVLPLVTIPGTPVYASVNGSGPPQPFQSLDLTAVVFQTQGLAVPITTPSVHPIDGLLLTLANGTAHFARDTGSGSIGGVMPLAGIAKVCLFGPCSGAIANIHVPLSVVGQGGMAFATAAVNLTVVGAPWTTATVAVGSIVRAGGYFTATGVTDRIHLVTPVFVSTNIALSAVIPVFAFLTIEGLAVPEPGTLILLGGGIAGLVAYGRSRDRS